MAFTLKQDLGASPDDQASCFFLSTRDWESMSFTANATYVCTQAEIAFKTSVGTSLGYDVTAYIYSDDGSGKPSSVLGTSTNTRNDALTSSFAYLPFQFGGVNLSSGTRYHVVVSSAGFDLSNYPALGLLTTGSGEHFWSGGDGSAWDVDDGAGQGTYKLYETAGAAWEPQVNAPEKIITVTPAMAWRN